MDGTRDERALRASDADRERVAEVLRAAAADGRIGLDELDERLERLYAAKTYGELEPVVEDLPGLADVRPGQSPEREVPQRVGGAPTSRVAKAIFGGVSRRGQWVVPAHYRVKAVFGGVDLDLREARLESAEVTIESKAVFGGVSIVVPPDVTVVMEGTGVFGGFGGDAEDVQPAPGAPVVRVTGKAVFGGVAVMRKPPSALPPL
ncbi:MAG TPA: DUF1707 domain-containing protein [Jiangellaceae bacterium]